MRDRYNTMSHILYQTKLFQNDVPSLKRKMTFLMKIGGQED